MNSERPLVSVLMTAYNREKFIGEAIESVLNSTYREFELLIVDDGSSDGTVALAQEYARADVRIRVYVNEKNLGDYKNRNKAAGYARGKYIKYVDSDDLIYPDSLAIFVTAMERYPEAAVGIMSRVSQEDRPFPFLLEPSEAYRYHFYKRGLFDTGPSALIFRTDRFREIGGFSGKRYVGDTEINLRMAARWPVVRMASSLVFWRQHDGQEIEAGQNSTGYLELQLPMFETEFANPQCPLTSVEKQRILAWLRKISARDILKIALVKRNPRTAFSFYKRLKLSPADVLNAIFFIKRKY